MFYVYPGSLQCARSPMGCQKMRAGRIRLRHLRMQSGPARDSGDLLSTMVTKSGIICAVFLILDRAYDLPGIVIDGALDRSQRKLKGEW